MKLIDMGTAKVLKSNKGFVQSKTFTIIGTPHYMAPEVLSGKGYNFYADLWSLGVCLYEFMCGMVPFGEEEEDPYNIYKIIMQSDKIDYPNYFKDKGAKKLIEQFLSRIPEVRLGSSYASLKNHVWFQGFDWDKLLNGKMKPPYIPTEDKIVPISDIQGNNERQSMEDVVKDLAKKRELIPVKASVTSSWDQEFNM